jgi:hypothetical protein
VSICSTTSKRVVVEHRQAFVQVQLDHVDAALHAGQHVVVGDLDAVAAAAALALQVVQQGAVAAAEVQHARALRHQAAMIQGGAVAHSTAPGQFAHDRRGRRGGDAVEVGAHHRQVARVFQQEGVVAVRGVDLGVADVAVGCRAAPSRARGCARREAPVGAEAHQQELRRGRASALARLPLRLAGSK